MKRRQKGRKHGCRTAAVCLMLLLLLILLKADFLPLMAALFNESSLTKVEDEMVQKVPSVGVDGATPQQQPLAVAKSEAAEGVDGATSQQQPLDVAKSEAAKGVAGATSKLTCNFSGYHSDTCTMEGDVRTHGKSGRVYVVSSSTYRPENSTVKIRPYARKWETHAMSRFREVTIRSSPPAAADGVILQRCTARHDVPAVVFSTGGKVYSRNFFHCMSDIIVPLFVTARAYGGRVQLLLTDYEAEWVDKWRPILAAVSAFPAIDFDSDAETRCFPAVQVGLESHRILGIDPGLARNGYTMVDFRDFLRSTFSLPRPWATPVSRSSAAAAGEKKKPRLVMVLRRRSRELTNEGDAMAALRELGFEVVAAGPEDVVDMARFAAVVNSCDVMVGVHGAGLTNMVFLPHNATVVQIIPWGGIKWQCWYDFGEPVPAMGLRYVEYEATAEETTLGEKYPRDHAVFTDPESIHRKSFTDLWSIFLNGQNVTLDIDRFREAMQQVYQSITID
ncbi:hypothetical protein ACP70R_046619 [Stipagrostis hirtigluma subsp. patula]